MGSDGRGTDYSSFLMGQSLFAQVWTFRDTKTLHLWRQIDSCGFLVDFWNEEMPPAVDMISSKCPLSGFFLCRGWVNDF